MIKKISEWRDLFSNVFLMCHESLHFSQSPAVKTSGNSGLSCLIPSCGLRLSLLTPFSKRQQQSNPHQSICCPTILLPLPSPTLLFPHLLSVWSTGTPSGSSHTSIYVRINQTCKHPLPHRLKKMVSGILLQTVLTPSCRNKE